MADGEFTKKARLVLYIRCLKMLISAIQLAQRSNQNKQLTATKTVIQGKFGTFEVMLCRPS